MLSNAELLAGFGHFQGQQNRKRRTIVVYKSFYRSFIAHIGDRSLLDATPADVESYLVAHCVQARSRYSYLSRLQTFYRWAIREGHTEINPTEAVPRPTLPRGVPRPISAADLHIALATADTRVKSMMLLAALAGLRCQEVAGIGVEDLLLHVRIPMLIVTHPKGWRERTVPLHPQIIDALRDYGLPRSGPIYPHTYIAGDPVGAHTVSRLVNQHLHSLGITSTAHQLRHYFGTALYQETHDIRLVAGLMGHEDPATTTVYAAYDQGEAASAIAALSV